MESKQEQLVKFKLNDISIKWQLMAICVCLITVPVIILGMLSYRNAESETFQQIEERLQQQAMQISLHSHEVINQIRANVEQNQQQARRIVSAQAESVYRFVDRWKGSLEDLKDVIASTGVGRTGYIWVVDYDGNYIVSKDRKRDGENIIDAKDSEGNAFIREAVEKARALSGNQVDYQIYPWKNIGERAARDKIAALVHIPQNQWVMGISVYFDELIDAQFEERKLNALKDELARIVVGKTGYIFILNEAGDYVLSHQRKRDGDNIWNAKDADGQLFIQEIIRNTSASGQGKTVVTYYPWKNTGETRPRMKLAASTYLPEVKWVIAPSAYQEDFLDGLKKIKTITVTITIVSILVGALVAYLFTMTMAKAFRKLAGNMDRISTGDLMIPVEEAQGKNELGRMSAAMEKMITNLKDTVKVAQEISRGDLDVEVKILSEKDVLGQSLSAMIANLKDAVKVAEQIAGGDLTADVNILSEKDTLGKSL